MPLSVDMIGVFDSGRGGLAALGEIRRALPHADVVYLADRKNAPYGTKSRGELIRLVSRDIERLMQIGAQKILIACCTASTVYPYLDEKYRRVSVPIINPTARLAARKSGGCVTVFATRATVASGAFSEELHSFVPSLSVKEIEAQGLVSLVESHARETAVSAEVKRLIGLMPDGCDTVVLGCTHFSFAKKIFSGLLGKEISVIDSAAVGAGVIIKKTPNLGNGRIIYS